MKSLIGKICDALVDVLGSDATEEVLDQWQAAIEGIIPATRETEFSFRVNKDQAKEEATTVKVTYNLAELSLEEVMEWACRGIDITLQSKLRSGGVKVEDVNGKVWNVPKPGDRKRLSEGDKVRKMVASLLGKKLEEVTDEEVMTVINRVMGK